jgi:hypothetical protein
VNAFEQLPSGVALVDAGLHRDAGPVGGQFGQRVGQPTAFLGLERLGRQGGAIGELDRSVPHGDRVNGGARGLRVAYCPLQRGVGLRRPVDPDHHPLIGRLSASR